MRNYKTLVYIALLISAYYLVYYIYVGILNPIPSLGDSWDYHIPIALSFLDGSFLSQPHNTIPGWHFPGSSLALHKIPQWYYPASSEVILALFILLHIPLTLSNVFAILFLFFVLWKLGLIFRLNVLYSLLYALTFCTLTAVLRWMNAISIDVWVGVWFALGIVLLENPKKTWVYFAKLGFVMGMLIGSKYTTIFYCLVFFIFYGKRLFRYISIQRGIIFSILFVVFGLFWYLRNYILTGNPVYPLSNLSMLGFKSTLSFNGSVWLATFHHPVDMLNAGFGEYKLWLFTVIVAVGVLIYNFVSKKDLHLSSMHKMFLIGLINFTYFFFNPTSVSQVWIMVSSFRYSYPVFIPLILGTFMLAVKYKKEQIVGYIVIANMLPVISMSYYPKLIFPYILLSLSVIYLLERKFIRVPSRF